MNNKECFVSEKKKTNIFSQNLSKLKLIVTFQLADIPKWSKNTILRFLIKDKTMHSNFETILMLCSLKEINFTSTKKQRIHLMVNIIIIAAQQN